jgi:carbon monoxide dehydrogenase subunit G
MSVRSFFLILALGMAVAVTGAAFGTDAVTLNFLQKGGVCDADGSFDVAADLPTAWAVLTDYDQMNRFVSGLKRSRLEEYSGRGRFLVEQEFEGGFLFVTKRVRVSLAVCETRCQSILFEDVGHKDFEFYKGSWELRHDPNGKLKISYSLTAQQNLNEPFAGNHMKNEITNLLESVRVEILRRQALAAVTASN